MVSEATALATRTDAHQCPGRGDDLQDDHRIGQVSTIQKSVPANYRVRSFLCYCPRWLADMEPLPLALNDVTDEAGIMSIVQKPIS
jgi:hypothetical protein